MKLTLDAIAISLVLSLFSSRFQATTSIIAEVEGERDCFGKKTILCNTLAVTDIVRELR